MSRHITYRGTTIDMEALMRENPKSVALGNMRVNARGDRLDKNGEVAKTADQIAREMHRTQTAIVHTGIKGDLPEVENILTEKPVKTTSSKSEKKTKEVELPTGDIVIEDEDER